MLPDQRRKEILEKQPRTIDAKDIVSCRILNIAAEGGYYELSPYDQGMPNQRKKPEAGYNKVACEFYMSDQGKCFLRQFFPQYPRMEHAPCFFAEA